MSHLRNSNTATGFARPNKARADHRLFRRRFRPRRGESGVTLIEVVLAVAVAAFVLTTATAFLVSISNIWTQRDQRHFFEDHVDGVTEFLRSTLHRAGTEIRAEANAGNGRPAEDRAEDNGEDEGGNNEESERGDTDSGSGGSRNRSSAQNDGGSAALLEQADEPVEWKAPPGFARYRDPLLHFTLNEKPPLFSGAETPDLPEIRTFLHFDRDDGLSLLWYSRLQENSEDVDDLHRTELSPFVKELNYVYWDERMEQWEETDEPKRGDGEDQFLLPRFVKFVFEHEGVTKERFLAIPAPSKNALLY